MYGIFSYIWVIFRANVGKYSTRGTYGINRQVLYIMTYGYRIWMDVAHFFTTKQQVWGFTFPCVWTPGLCVRVRVFNGDHEKINIKYDDVSDIPYSFLMVRIF